MLRCNRRRCRLHRETTWGNVVRRLSRDVKACLNKARESAILAVGTYNRPGTVFRSGAYIVLMVIAWSSLLHAIFLRKRVRPFYTRVKEGRYVRYEKVDGDYKAWDLKECVKQFYKDHHPPVRRNLEFFIGLRNKIEHRNMPATRRPNIRRVPGAPVEFRSPNSQRVRRTICSQ